MWLLGMMYMVTMVSLLWMKHKFTCILIILSVKLDHVISVMDRYRYDMMLCYHGNNNSAFNAIHMVNNIS